MLNSPVLYTKKPFLLLSVQYFTYRVHFLKCFGSFVIWVFKTKSKRLCMASIYVYKLNLGGQINFFGGGPRVFGPHKQNLRGQKNDFYLI